MWRKINRRWCSALVSITRRCTQGRSHELINVESKLITVWRWRAEAILHLSAGMSFQSNEPQHAQKTKTTNEKEMEEKIKEKSMPAYSDWNRHTHRMTISEPTGATLWNKQVFRYAYLAGLYLIVSNIKSSAVIRIRREYASRKGKK